MINLDEIKKDIDTLQKALDSRKKDYKLAKESNMREQYGDDFSCHNCAYSCCVDVGDHCTYCYQSNCIYCKDYCDDYVPDNEFSKYIRKYHYYEERMLDAINKLFDVDDIIKHPELHDKALHILKVRDKDE